MKSISKIFIAFVFMITSCNQHADIDKTDPLESGRGFIEASLKGDYVRAEKYLLKDSTNVEYLDGLRDFNSKRTPLERENYRDANIIIDSIKKASDSVSIIYYSNTYKNTPTKIKMVKENNEWLVDFKYTFNNK